jgi:uncharacterized protein (TIGR02996 family)
MIRWKAHPEATALYQAVLAHPDEDTPRLVFADWLTEHGEHDRAEFIRLQCRLARMNAWDDGYTADHLRCKRLQQEHEEEWVERPEGADPNAYGPSPFVRGFVGEAKASSWWPEEDLHRHFAAFPITRLRCNFISHTNELSFTPLTSPSLPNLHSIWVGFTEYPSRTVPPVVAMVGCRALAEAACRSGLVRLEIAGDPTLEGLEALITSPHLRNLEALEVRGDGVGDDHARLLAEKMNLPALRELVLGHKALTPLGARFLGRAEWFAKLHALRVYGHGDLGDEGVENLLAAPHLALRTLEIHCCGQSNSVVRLAGGANLPDLVEVIARQGFATAPDLDLLGSGPQTFRSLELPEVRVWTERAADFFGGPAVRDLRRLVISERLNAPVTRALIESQIAQSLRSLDIGCTSDTDPGALLLAGPDWPHLERLRIHTGMPADSLVKLIASDKFPRLVSLSATPTTGAARVLKRVARCPAVARFRELDLNVPMTAASARELLESPHLANIDRFTTQQGRAPLHACNRLGQRFGNRFEMDGLVWSG